MPPSKEKKRYITYRVDSYLRDKFLPNRLRRPRESCSESCIRFINFSKFAVSCLASLFQALAPWMLAVMEVAAVLLIYFFAFTENRETDHSQHSSDFYHNSINDIVGLTCARSLILSLAYAFGGRYMHRPYLYASYILAAICFPYILIKIVLFSYTTQAVPAALIFALAASFCWMHMFAARTSVEWARRRYRMGLVGFGYLWSEEKDMWGLVKHGDLEDASRTSEDASFSRDVPPEALADVDSRFVTVDHIKVHYKEEAPHAACLQNGNFAVILVHGFGAGVFAWRHLMRPLAEQAQCRVIAFDRPAFGLTERPIVTDPSNSPYSMDSQAHLLLGVCRALGVKNAIFIAHADGCAVAVRAVQLASKSQVPVSYGPPISICTSQGPDVDGGSLEPSDVPTCSLLVDTGDHALSEATGHALEAQSQKSGAGKPAVAHRESGRGAEPASVMTAPRALPHAEVCTSHHHRRCMSLPAEVCSITGRGPLDEPSTSNNCHEPVQVLGLALLHPNLTGQVGRTLSRLLSRYRLGPTLMRPLLRTEIGEVANRRAWHHVKRLTPEVLALYTAPLRVEGWDLALLEFSRSRPAQEEPSLTNLPEIPVLVATGEFDRIIPPKTAETLAAQVRHGTTVVLADCGHLSHEEAPDRLIATLEPFCRQLLLQSLQSLVLSGAELSP